MWSWVEQLKEPVLTKEDVDMLAESQVEAAEALFLLQKVKWHSSPRSSKSVSF